MSVNSVMNSTDPIYQQQVDSLQLMTANAPTGIEPSVVFVVNDTVEKIKVIDFCRTKCPNAEIVTVFKPNDLNEDDLKSVVTCTELGKVNENTGRLYTNEHIILFIDLSVMSPAQIASINDVLEDPPKYNGRELGSNIYRVVLIKKIMMNCSAGSPSGDCWRRLEQFVFWYENESIKLLPTPNVILPNVESQLECLDLPLELTATTNTAEKESLATKSQLIDFCKNANWRALLFGSLSLDEHGQIIFEPGVFAKACDGNILSFRDAPWKNPSFVFTLREALIKGSYQANGMKCKLPSNITIRSCETSNEEMLHLKAEIISKVPIVKSRFFFTQSNKFQVVCINRFNFTSIFSDIVIKDGKALQVDTFSQLIKDCREVLVTDELEQPQQLLLLRKIQEYEDLNLTFLNEPSGTKTKLGNCSKGVKIMLADNYDEVSASADSKSFIYHVSSKDDWNSMLFTLRLKSQNNLIFENEETLVLKKLKKGEKLILNGVESNPSIMGHIESLLMPKPYIFVLGNKLELPKVNLTLVLSKKFLIANPHKMAVWKRPSIVPIKSTSNPKCKQYKQFFYWLNELVNSHIINKRALSGFSNSKLEALIEKQIEVEMKCDNATERSNYHIRKAIRFTLAQAYRYDSNLYYFIKLYIYKLWPEHQELEGECDAVYLKDWLTKNSPLTKSKLQANFWMLAYKCNKSLVHSDDLIFINYKFPKVHLLQSIAGYLFEYCTDDDKHLLQTELKICRNDMKPLYGSSPDSEKQLKHSVKFLLSGVDKDDFIDARPLHVIAREIINELRALKSGCNHIYDQECLSKVKDILTLRVRFQENTLTDEFCLKILTGDLDSSSFKKNKTNRLLSSMEIFPMIFLQGKTGSGKSYYARQLSRQWHAACQNKCTQEATIISLGPMTDNETLYRSQQLVTDVNGDTETLFVDGPLLKWAKSKGFLILDEANLPKEGILTPLTGITENNRVLHFNGNVYALTSEHKVILTGNTEDYDGRLMDPLISSRVLTIFFDPISSEQIANQLINSLLPSDWPADKKKYAYQAILFLYDNYKTIIPHSSPREIKEIFSRAYQILRYSHATEISKEQIYALFLVASSEALSGAVTFHNRGFEYQFLNDYMTKFHCDFDVLTGRNSAFNAFLTEVQQHSGKGVDLKSKSVIELIHSYWVFLDKQINRDNVGKTALVVEGPAGWGKDLVLKHVLLTWTRKNQVPHDHINANTANLSEISMKIKRARESGQLLAISEINLLPSRYLEGLLNDPLTDESRTGFLLIITINPPSYSGREVMSDALKSRCIQVQVSNYTLADLEGVIKRLFDLSQLSANFFAKLFFTLESEIEKQGCPFKISLQVIIRSLNAIASTESQNWFNAFCQFFQRQLKAIDFTPEMFWSATKRVIYESNDMLALELNDYSMTLMIDTLVPTVIRQAIRQNKNLKINISPEKVKMSPNDEYRKLEHKHTFNCHKKIAIFFNTNRFKHSEYRLSVYELELAENSFKFKRITFDDNNIRFLNINKDAPEQLQTFEILGTGFFQLSKRTWHPLPGLSSNDFLCFIRAREDVELIIGFDSKSKCHVVKLSDNNPKSSGSFQLDFIIIPSFQALSRDLACLQIDYNEQLCPKGIKQELNKRIFNDTLDMVAARIELFTIKAIEDNSKKLIELVQWFGTFDILANDLPINERLRLTFLDFISDMQSDELDIIVKILMTKRGMCRHKCWVFCLLCLYFGYTARVIENDQHAYVEISANQGTVWRKIMLPENSSATGTFVSKYTYNRPDFLDIQYSKAAKIANESSIKYQSSNLGARRKIAKKQLPHPKDDIPYLTKPAQQTDMVRHSEITPPESIMVALEEYLQALPQYIVEKFSKLIWSLKQHQFDYRAYSILPETVLLGKSAKCETLYCFADFMFLKELPKLMMHWHYLSFRHEKLSCYEKHFLNMVNRERAFFDMALQLWRIGKVTDELIINFINQCQPLFQSNIILIRYFYTDLEKIIKRNPTAINVAVLLNNYVSGVTRGIEWNEKNAFPLKAPPAKAVGKQSNTLHNLLNIYQSSHEWKWYPRYESLNVTRLAARKAPFPEQQDGSEKRPFILCLPLKHFLLEEVKNIKSKANTSDVEQVASTITEDYLSYLSVLLNDFKGFCVVMEPATITVDGKPFSLQSGHYRMTSDNGFLYTFLNIMPEIAVSKIKGVYQEETDFSLPEIMKIPNACVINKELAIKGLTERLA